MIIIGKMKLSDACTKKSVVLILNARIVCITKLHNINSPQAKRKQREVVKKK